MEVAELERNEKVQKVSLPEGFQIDDDRVFVKRQGNMICLIPYHSVWDNFFNSGVQVSDDFMNERDQGEDQERESFD